MDNIAYASEAVFLDFEGLFDRLGNATGRNVSLLALSDVSSTYPSLDDIYFAHYHLFEAVVTAIRAFWRYLACCHPRDRMKTLAVVDDDPEAAIHNFYKEDARVRTSIDRMAACWNETRHRLPYELGVKLRVPARLDWAEWVGLPWLADSQHVLRTDVPNIIKKAEWHLANFRYLYESLEGCVKQIECETAYQPVETLLSPLLLLFTHYRFGLAAATGPIPDLMK